MDGQPAAGAPRRRRPAPAVEDSLNLPDPSPSPSEIPHREVLDEGRVKIGARWRSRRSPRPRRAARSWSAARSPPSRPSTTPSGTHDDRAGLRPSHRLFRGRTTETYANVTYSDVARKVAGRAGLAVGQVDAATTVHDHVSQGNVTDWQFLSGLARARSASTSAVFDGKFEFRKPAESAEGPDAGSLATEDPLQLALGNPAALPVRRHLGRAGQGGPGAGLGHAPEEGGRGHGAGQDDDAPPSASSPTDLAGTLRQPALRRRRACPTTSQAEVDAAARRSPSRSPAPSPSSRGWPGATPSCGPARR